MVIPPLNWQEGSEQQSIIVQIKPLAEAPICGTPILTFASRLDK
jgi:hypothetical protein